ncbi:MAG: aspartate kinase [Bdellovibrionales bacterium]|nr:aspartate kinase [Bdellovibrionales bacterium]
MYSRSDKNQPIVQKYGGTSVGTVERIRAIAARVARQRAAGWRKIAVVVSAMAGETNRFVELVGMVNPDAAAKHYDLAVAAGEQVSTALMAAALEREGVPAEAFLAYQIGLRAEGLHAKARIRSIETARLEACWAAGGVPVVAGFQGVGEQNELMTLGRGGSDISAVALAVALKASFCEINTDVEGVFTADPRFVPGARLVEVLDYDSALEMAALGSKVLHSRCVELGAKYAMPIVVRNSFDVEEARRTQIMSFTESQALEAPVVTGVSLDRNVCKFTLTGLRRGSSVLSTIFERVAEAGANVDIIIQNEISESDSMRLGFTVGNADDKLAVQALETLQAEPPFDGMEFSRQEDLAKVSVVGLGMKSYAGVASRAFAALAGAGIEILMTSTSEIKISCVVPAERADEAARAWHNTFFAN